MLLIILCFIINCILSFSIFMVEIVGSRNWINQPWYITPISMFMASMFTILNISQLGGGLFTVPLLFTLMPLLFLGSLNTWRNCRYLFFNFSDGPNHLPKIETLLNECKFALAYNKLQPLEKKYPSNLCVLRLMVQVHEHYNSKLEIMKSIQIIYTNSTDEAEREYYLNKAKAIDSTLAHRIEHGIFATPRG